MKPVYRLAVAVVILIVVGVVLFRPHKLPPPAKVSKPLLTVKAAEVQGITIEQPGDPEVVVSRNGGGWNLVQPYAFAADSATIQDMLGTLNDITGAEDVGKVSNLAEFGLDKPSSITFTLAGGKNVTLEFGSLTPTGGSVYARLGAGGPVEAIPAPIKDGLLKTGYELQDKDLIHFPAGKVTGLVITRDGIPHRYQQTGGAWPKQQQSAIQSLLDALQDGEMSAMVDRTGKAAAAHGLAHPPTTVQLTWKGGSAQLDIGARKSTDAYYGRNSETPAVFTLDSYIVDDITAVISPAKASSTKSKSAGSAN